MVFQEDQDCVEVSSLYGIVEGGHPQLQERRESEVSLFLFSFPYCILLMAEMIDKMIRLKCCTMLHRHEGKNMHMCLCVGVQPQQYTDITECFIVYTFSDTNIYYMEPKFVNAQLLVIHFSVY